MSAQPEEIHNLLFPLIQDPNLNSRIHSKLSEALVHLANSLPNFEMRSSIFDSLLTPGIQYLMSSEAQEAVQSLENFLAHFGWIEIDQFFELQINERDHSNFDPSTFDPWTDPRLQAAKDFSRQIHMVSSIVKKCKPMKIEDSGEVFHPLDNMWEGFFPVVLCLCRTLHSLWDPQIQDQFRQRPLLCWVFGLSRVHVESCYPSNSNQSIPIINMAGNRVTNWFHDVYMGCYDLLSSALIQFPRIYSDTILDNVLEILFLNVQHMQLCYLKQFIDTPFFALFKNLPSFDVHSDIMQPWIDFIFFISDRLNDLWNAHISQNQSLLDISVCFDVEKGVLSENMIRVTSQQMIHSIRSVIKYFPEASKVNGHLFLPCFFSRFKFFIKVKREWQEKKRGG